MLKTSAKLEMVVGALAIITGSLYVFNVFGQTESTVTSWGMLAVVLGGVIVFSGMNKHNVTYFLEKVLVFCLVLIQTPAIFLWFTFNSRGISDGTPPGDFVAHWAFALPHIVILLLGTILIFSLSRKNMT